MQMKNVGMRKRSAISQASGWAKHKALKPNFGARISATKDLAIISITPEIMAIEENPIP